VFILKYGYGLAPSLSNKERSPSYKILPTQLQIDMLAWGKVILASAKGKSYDSVLKF
jgi:hypothetical protein